jgi:hypothetical protein
MGLGTVGGLAGGIFGTIRNSWAGGSVSNSSGGYAGGLVGYTAGSIYDSYSISSVSGVSPLGGLVGYSFRSTVTDGYYDSQTSGQSDTGKGTPQTTAQLTSGLPTGFDPTVWGSNASINNGYPYLLWTQASSPPASPTVFMPTAAATPTSPTASLPPGVAPFPNLQVANLTQGINTTVAVSTPTKTQPNNYSFVSASNAWQYLTEPQLESMVALAFGDLLGRLPASVAPGFETQVRNLIVQYLGKPGDVVSITDPALIALDIALSALTQHYIEQYSNTLNNPVLAGSVMYAAQVAANSGIDYLTALLLNPGGTVATGGAGVAGAIGAGVAQSTISDVFQLLSVLSTGAQ